MKDHPIIFSAPMVRALIDGRKTQTRRDLARSVKWDWLWELEEAKSADELAHLAKYKIGDRLWVRERVAYRHDVPEDKSRDVRWYSPVYEADGIPSGFGISDLKPAMYMPRWASRLTLTVTGAKIERLHDISIQDALAEGWPGAKEAERMPATKWYRHLWDKINGDGAWERNPWVAAYTFTVEQRNIDQPEQAA